MKILHKVSSFDTLDSVAKKYNVDVNELIKINDLKTGSIHGLDSLFIPKNDSDFVVVKNLDKEILLEVKFDNKDLINRLVNDKSYVCSAGKNAVIEEGDKIILKNSNHKHHVVKPLETLNSISNKFGVTSEYLINVNHLKTHKLFIGQKLII